MCVAVGGVQGVTRDEVEAAAAIWSDGKWEGLSVLPSPVKYADGSIADPESVSCASASFCVAVGDSFGDRFEFHGLIETYTP